MSIESNFERQAHKSILKYAVQRAMFNHDGSVADVRRSVLIEITIPEQGSTMKLLSSAQFDSLSSLADWVRELPLGSVIEVWDGRFLFGTGRSHSGHLRFEHVTPSAPQAEVLF